MTPHRSRNIAAAFFNLDLHIELAAVRQMRNDMVRIDDLNVMRRLYVCCGDDAVSLFSQAQRDFVAVVQFEYHALEVQQNVDDVFLNTVDRRVLMQDAGYRHLGRRVTGH